MPLIKDSAYRQFLDTGLIRLIDKDVFEESLAKVQHTQKEQARALLILLYYTGARPSEILELRGGSVKKEGRYMKILIPTKKRGRYRTLYLLNKGHIQEALKYAREKVVHPDIYLFWKFRGKNKKVVKYRTLRDGIVSKDYVETTKIVWYWVKKWMGYTPYFLRHNRFSGMASKGASDFEIMFAKGAIDLKSVSAYRHMSQRQAKKTAKYMQ